MKETRHRDPFAVVKISEFDLHREADLAELMLLLSETPPSVEEFIATGTKDISDRLERREWPRPERWIKLSGERWQYVDAREGPGKYSSGWGYIQNRAEPLSSDALLVTAFLAFQTANDRFHSDDREGAFWAAMALSAALNAFNVRVTALKPATAGAKSIQGAARENERRTNQSFAARYGAAAQERAAALLKENPRRTWAHIQNLLAFEYGVSERTIRGAVKNPRK